MLTQLEVNVFVFYDELMMIADWVGVVFRKFLMACLWH